MNSNPYISIIMPAYNAGKYISETIESIICQTFTSWELIIINDGSTDDTADKVESYIQKDSRIKLIHQENKKQAGARNTGIKKAEGQWLAFIDADDLWMPYKLEVQKKYIELKNPDIIYTSGYELLQDSNEKRKYQTKSGFFQGEILLKDLFNHNFIPVLSVLMKKDWVKKIGYQDESLIVVGCEDYDYWVRLAKSGASFLGIQEELFIYRIHENSMSKDTTQMRLAVNYVLAKNYTELLNQHHDLLNKFRYLMKSLFLDVIEKGRSEKAKLILDVWKLVEYNSKVKLLHVLLYYFPIVLNSRFIWVIKHLI